MTLRGENVLDGIERRRRRRRATAPYRAKNAEYQRRWYARNRKRLAMASAAFTLHDLRCPYPSDGCSCRAIVVTR